MDSMRVVERHALRLFLVTALFGYLFGLPIALLTLLVAGMAYAYTFGRYRVGSMMATILVVVVITKLLLPVASWTGDLAPLATQGSAARLLNLDLTAGKVIRPIGNEGSATLYAHRNTVEEALTIALAQELATIRSNHELTPEQVVAQSRATTDRFQAQLNALSQTDVEDPRWLRFKNWVGSLWGEAKISEWPPLGPVATEIDLQPDQKVCFRKKTRFEGDGRPLRFLHVPSGQEYPIGPTDRPSFEHLTPGAHCYIGGLLGNHLAISQAS